VKLTKNSQEIPVVRWMSGQQTAFICPDVHLYPAKIGIIIYVCKMEIRKKLKSSGNLGILSSNSSLSRFLNFSREVQKRKVTLPFQEEHNAAGSFVRWHS
jgi:hypothetical protein